jgi:hypothetical protein
MGRYDLGLDDEEFWRLTYREFAALADRKKLSERALNQRAALIASTVVNSQVKLGKALGVRGGQMVEVEDFMPKAPSQAQTREEQRQKIQEWAQALRERVKRT